MTNGGHSGKTDAACQEEVAVPATGALTVVGQVSSVLEVHAVQIDVRAQLKTLVPVWQWADGMGTVVPLDRTARRCWTKMELFDQLPAPEGQLEHAWRELFAFELHGRSFAPDHKTLFQAWKQAMLRFTLNGGSGAVVGAQNFLEADDTTSEHDLTDSETELLDAVRRAIWWSPRLRKPTETTTPQDDIGELEQATTTAWVGKLALRNTAKDHDDDNDNDDQAVDAEQFMTSWRNVLPEKWGLGLELDLMEPDTFQLGTDPYGRRTIKWLPGEDSDSAGAAGVGRKEKAGLESGVAKASTTRPTGPLAGKRKWHDKFQASRNVKR